MVTSPLSIPFTLFFFHYARHAGWRFFLIWIFKVGWFIVRYCREVLYGYKSNNAPWYTSVYGVFDLNTYKILSAY
jgi:hypothetical protein